MPTDNEVSGGAAVNAEDTTSKPPEKYELIDLGDTEDVVQPTEVDRKKEKVIGPPKEYELVDLDDDELIIRRPPEKPSAEELSAAEATAEGLKKQVAKDFATSSLSDHEKNRLALGLPAKEEGPPEPEYRTVLGAAGEEIDMAPQPEEDTPIVLPQKETPQTISDLKPSVAQAASTAVQDYTQAKEERRSLSEAVSDMYDIGDAEVTYKDMPLGMSDKSIRDVIDLDKPIEGLKRETAEDVVDFESGKYKKYDWNEPIPGYKREDIQDIINFESQVFEKGNITDLDTHMTNEDYLVTRDYYKDKLGFMDLFRDKIDKPDQLIPFLHDVTSGIHFINIAQASKKLMNDDYISPQELAMLYEFHDKLNAKKSWLYTIGDIVSQTPAFMGEFLATAGAFTAGKKATKAVGKEALEKTFKYLFSEGGEKALKSKLAQYAGKGAAVVGGATLQSVPIGAIRVPARVAELKMPQLYDSPLGLQAIENDMSTAGAFKNAAVDNWIEVVSEHSGPMLGVMKKALPEKALKNVVVEAISKAYPKIENKQIRKLLETTAYHGPIEEFFEERVGSVMRVLYGLEGFELPDKENFVDVMKEKASQYSAEFVAFTVPGVAGKAIDAVKPTPKYATVIGVKEDDGAGKDKAKEYVADLSVLLDIAPGQIVADITTGDVEISGKDVTEEEVADIIKLHDSYYGKEAIEREEKLIGAPDVVDGGIMPGEGEMRPTVADMTPEQIEKLGVDDLITAAEEQMALLEAAERKKKELPPTQKKTQEKKERPKKKPPISKDKAEPETPHVTHNDKTGKTIIRSKFIGPAMNAIRSGGVFRGSFEFFDGLMVGNTPVGAEPFLKNPYHDEITKLKLNQRIDKGPGVTARRRKLQEEIDRLTALGETEDKSDYALDSYNFWAEANGRPKIDDIGELYALAQQEYNNVEEGKDPTYNFKTMDDGAGAAEAEEPTGDVIEEMIRDDMHGKGIDDATIEQIIKEFRETNHERSETYDRIIAEEAAEEEDFGVTEEENRFFSTDYINDEGSVDEDFTLDELVAIRDDMEANRNLYTGRYEDSQSIFNAIQDRIDELEGDESIYHVESGINDALDTGTIISRVPYGVQTDEKAVYFSELDDWDGYLSINARLVYNRKTLENKIGKLEKGKNYEKEKEVLSSEDIPLSSEYGLERIDLYDGPSFTHVDVGGITQDDAEFDAIQELRDKDEAAAEKAEKELIIKYMNELRTPQKKMISDAQKYANKYGIPVRILSHKEIGEKPIVIQPETKDKSELRDLAKQLWDIENEPVEGDSKRSEKNKTDVMFMRLFDHFGIDRTGSHADALNELKTALAEYGFDGKAAVNDFMQAFPEFEKIDYHNITLYHGQTGEDSTPEFKNSVSWWEGEGFYLTPNKEDAENYAGGASKGIEETEDIPSGNITAYKLKKDANVLPLNENVSKHKETWKAILKHIFDNYAELFGVESKDDKQILIQAISGEDGTTAREFIFEGAFGPKEIETEMRFMNEDMPTKIHGLDEIQKAWSDTLKAVGIDATVERHGKSFQVVVKNEDAIVGIVGGKSTTGIPAPDKAKPETQTVYRGTKEGKTGSGFYEGTHYTTDENRAKEFGDTKKYTITGKFFDLSDNDLQDKLVNETGTPASGVNLSRKLKDMGYDGIKRGNEYILFDAEKLAKEEPAAQPSGTSLYKPAIDLIGTIPSYQRTYPAGNALKQFRQRVIELLTGTKPPLSKSGVTAYKDALVKAAGIDTKGKAPVQVERELQAWMKDISESTIKETPSKQKVNHPITIKGITSDYTTAMVDMVDSRDTNIKIKAGEPIYHITKIGNDTVDETVSASTFEKMAKERKAESDDIFGEKAPKEKKYKEPWEMTKNEFDNFYNKHTGPKGQRDYGITDEEVERNTAWWSVYDELIGKWDGKDILSDAEKYGGASQARHRRLVENAIKENKPIPDAVKKEYPDLFPPEAPPKAPKEEKQQDFISGLEGYDSNLFDDLHNIEDDSDAAEEFMPPPKKGSKAHLTAIARKTLSVPMKYLESKGLIKGKSLDYGSGRGFDADTLGMDKYDPYYSPEMPTGKYKTITNNYVLNVIDTLEGRLKVLENIINMLEDDGVAYVTVRRDVPKSGYTSRGTYQDDVILPYESIKKTSGYEIYKLTKKDKPEVSTPEFDDSRKPPGGYASSGGYADIPPIDNRPDSQTDEEKKKEREKYDATPYLMSMPDLVEFAKLIMGGKVPRIKKKLSGLALGRFLHPKKTKYSILYTDDLNISNLDAVGERGNMRFLLAEKLGGNKYKAIEWKRKISKDIKDNEIFIDYEEARIELLAGIFQDLDLALKVISHELGHAVDYLPNKMIEGRGNILGHIKSLKKWTKHFLPNYPGAKGVLTEKEKSRLRREAEKTIGETAEVWLDVEITKTIGLEPADVIAIWNESSERIKKENPRLYDYVAGLSAAEKKSIIKEAMKGTISDKLKQFVRKIRVRTGERIKKKVPTNPQDILNEYHRLIKREIEKRALWSRDQITDELRSWTQFWNPFDANADAEYTKYRYSNAELFAEALSGLMTNPVVLQERAPNFYRAYFNYIENRPHVKAAWDEIQNTIHTGGTLDKARGRLRDGFMRKEEQWLERMKTIRGKGLMSDELGRVLIDKFYPLWRRMRGQDHHIPDDANPIYSIGEWEHSGAEATAYSIELKDQVIEPMRANNISATDLGEYLFHKRVLADRKSMANPEGFTEKESTEAIKDIEKRHGKVIKEIADAFYKIRQDRVIKKAKASGMFAPELIKKMEDTVEYATFDIVKEFESRYGGNAESPLIFKQIGTLADTGNPLTATIAKDMAIMRAINKNKAKEDTVQFLLKAGEAVEAEKLQGRGGFTDYKLPTERDKGLIKYVKGGELKGYYIPKEIAKGFEFSDLNDLGVWRLWRSATNAMKMIFTGARLGFYPFNAIRDAFEAVKNTPGLTFMKFAPYYIRSMKKAFPAAFGQNRPEVMELLDMMSLISAGNYRGWREADTELERILKRAGVYELHQDVFEKDDTAKDYSRIDGVRKIMKGPMLLLDVINSLGTGIEWTPKIAVNEWIKENRPDMSDQERAYHIREMAGSPNFLRHSASSPITNTIFLYSNPMVRGWQRVGRRLSLNWKDYMLKTILYSAPEIALKYAILGGGLDWLDEYFKNDDIARMKYIYKRISKYDRINYNIVPLGISKFGEAIYLRIPRDEPGKLFGGIASILLEDALKDEGGFKSIIKMLPHTIDYASGQAPNVNPLLSAASAMITYGAGFNPYDAFRQRRIVDDRTFTAGGMRAHKQMMAWVANSLGAGYIKRFKTYDENELKTWYKTMVNMPFAQDVVGRFLKVSDYGITEEYNEILKEDRKKKAGMSLNAEDGIKALLNGDVPANKQLTAMLAEWDNIDNKVTNRLNQMYGTPELRALKHARTNEERMKLYIEMMENQKDYDPFAKKDKK